MENREMNVDDEDWSLSSRPRKRRVFACPWKTASDFHEVYNLLFNKSTDQQMTDNWKKAFTKLDVWTLRRGSLCPAAIHATKVLIEVLLKNDQYTLKEKQIFYGAAFLRFINYMSSVMHQYGTHLSMYDKAKELGMPSFLIDLRHICAHGDMIPSIKMLYNAAICCLKWLHTSYWEKQNHSLSNINIQVNIPTEVANKSEDELSALLFSFDVALYAYVIGIKNKQLIKGHIPSWRYQILKENSQDTKIITTRFMYRLLLDLQLLLENDAKLRKSPTICVGYLLDMYCIYKIIEEGIHKNSEDYRNLIELIQPLFRLLAMFNILEKFFLRLLDIIENLHCKEKPMDGFAFWALRIAEGFQLAAECRNLFAKRLEQNENIAPEEPLELDNIHETTELMRELAYYCKKNKNDKLLILLDTMQRPWMWSFNTTFLLSRLVNVNKYTRNILKCLLPISEPRLDPEVYNFINNVLENHELDNSDENIRNVLISSFTDDLQVLISRNHLDQSFLQFIINRKAIKSSTQRHYGSWFTLDTRKNNWKQLPLGMKP